MLLQYNTVFDRIGGLAQMTNPNWPQWVSTLIPPEGNELANGTYHPSLAPVNFLESKKGTRWATVWYAGPLSINNMRGRLQFVPTNLQRFTADEGSGANMDADPSLPDYERDVQFTVNGLFEPVLKVNPGQTEIWAVSYTHLDVYKRQVAAVPRRAVQRAVRAWQQRPVGELAVASVKGMQVRSPSSHCRCPAQDVYKRQLRKEMPRRC